MSWDRRPDRGLGHYQVNYFELYESEVTLIKPLIENRLKIARKKLEYYTDLHDGGEATSKDETLRIKWENTVGVLERILNRI